MLPLVRDNAYVEVKAQRWYWPGDIVAIRCSDNRLRLHRVLGYRFRGWRTEIVTQGDSSEKNDVPVPCHGVVGKVVGGDCSQLAVDPPLRHRMMALGRYTRIVYLKLITRRKQRSA